MSRVERILSKLAQRHAPHLLTSGFVQTNDRVVWMQTIGRKLADHGVLVAIGGVSPVIAPAQQVHIEDWIGTTARLYRLLAGALFPSLNQLTAHYADDQHPVVVVLEGSAGPVLAALAGCIIPYVGLRQVNASSVTEKDLDALMDVVLAQLEATDLPMATYNGLRDNAVVLLRQMLSATVRHISLTGFDPAMLPLVRSMTDRQAPAAPGPLPGPPAPASAPQTPPSPARPAEQPAHELELLPDDDQPPTPTEQMFVDRLPLPRGGSRRMPPVPNLPEQDADEA
ncbi:MAG: hypothetical protein ACOCX3_00425 [Chloroflexota bacterium]